MQSFITLGKKIYHIEKSREARRMVVFVARCLLNRSRMEKLDRYFHKNALLAELAEIYPFVHFAKKPIQIVVGDHDPARCSRGARGEKKIERCLRGRLRQLLASGRAG